MEDTLGFEETEKKSSVTEWHLGIQSDLSMLEGSNQESYQQNLYVIQKKEEILKRPKIPASLAETLSFYRCFTSSASKVELYCMQQNNVNRFFWFYISNLLCKSLPMAYVYVFLSAYSPDHHYFLPKMAPICHGFNWILIITAFCGLFLLANNTSLYFTYLLTGLVNKTPWNRCPNETINIYSITFNCYNLSEFSKKFNDTNITYQVYYYISSNNERFSLAQMEYFDFLFGDIELFGLTFPLYVLNILLWTLTIFLHKQIFKKYIWKVLHYTHLLLLCMFIAIFIHLTVVYEESNITEVVTAEDYEREYLMNADFDLLAESMTAPPLVHILSSRSMNEIKPNLHSAMIVLSNGMYYIFRALTTYMMKNYCERWVNGTIIYWNYGSGSLFYYWPMYFATLYLGDLFVIIFFAFNTVVDYCTFIITFQCLVESIVSEWKWIRSWCVVLLLAALGIVETVTIDYYQDYTFSENCFLFWTSVSTLVEMVIIFWVYPDGRLVDDITFHYGLQPTRLRIWSFVIAPVFYSIKIYIMISRFLTLMRVNLTFKNVSSSRNAFLYQSILFLSGGLYSFYYYVIKRNKSWTQLFRPVPEWGPRDFSARQLRKQYDSRKYTVSQASTSLSRHLIGRAEMKSYKLDIPYDTVTRRTTINTEADKK